MESYIVGWICAVVILVFILLAFVIFVAIIISQGSPTPQNTLTWVVIDESPTFDLLIDSENFIFGYKTNKKELWYKDKKNYPLNYWIVLSDLLFQIQDFQLTDQKLVILDTSFQLWSRTVVLNNQNVFPASFWVFGFSNTSSLPPWKYADWLAVNQDGKDHLLTRIFGSNSWSSLDNKLDLSKTMRAIHHQDNKI